MCRRDNPIRPIVDQKLIRYKRVGPGKVAKSGLRPIPRPLPLSQRYLQMDWPPQVPSIVNLELLREESQETSVQDTNSKQRGNRTDGSKPSLVKATESEDKFQTHKLDRNDILHSVENDSVSS